MCVVVLVVFEVGPRVRTAHGRIPRGGDEGGLPNNWMVVLGMLFLGSPALLEIPPVLRATAVIDGLPSKQPF